MVRPVVLVTLPSSWSNPGALGAPPAPSPRAQIFLQKQPGHAEGQQKLQFHPKMQLGCNWTRYLKMKTMEGIAVLYIVI